MKVAIHQPEYFPVPRLLAKWASVDLFVVLDLAQFDRTSLQHRARLRDEVGAYRWLTIPFVHEFPRQLRALEVADDAWTKRHWWQIREWYRKVGQPAALDEVATWFEAMAGLSLAAVGRFAWESMLFLAERVGIVVPAVQASTLRPPPGGWGHKSDFVLNLCRVVGATTYVSGVSGTAYLDWAAFHHARISVEVQAAREPSDVPPNLSALHSYLVGGARGLIFQTLGGTSSEEVVR